MSGRKILLGLGAAALAGGGLAALRWSDERRIDRLWRGLEDEARGGERDRFAPAMVADVPEPARRYLLRAIRPWAELPRGVVLEMRGEIRPRPGAPWRAIAARQLLVPLRGFVWRPASPDWMDLAGGDWYADGRGGQRINLFGFPLVRAAGADVNRSAGGRLAMESVLCPSALVPGRGGAWAAIDDRRAAWTAELDGQEMTLTVEVAEDGALESVSMPRWGNPGGAGWRETPFGVRVEEEGRFGGLRLPRRLTAIWGFTTPREHEFYRATLRSVEWL